MGNLVAVATEQPTITMIAKENPQGFHSSIASIVVEVIQISGRKDIADADKLFLIEKTKEELLTEYRFLTGAEVRYAFGQGVRGRYGDYYHINLPTFIKWLDKYLQSDERERIVDSKRNRIPVNRQLAESGTHSEQDMAEIYRHRANYNYKQYLETGKIEVAGLSSLRQLFEDFIFQQMSKDGKVLKGEKTVEDVFVRFKEDGKEVIYEGY